MNAALSALFSLPDDRLVGALVVAWTACAVVWSAFAEWTIRRNRG